MNPEKRHLIGDLLDEAENYTGRAATLRAGGRILQRRRRWRMARGGLVLIAALFVATLGVQLFVGPKPGGTRAGSPTPPPGSSGIRVHSLTDAELLSLFPNTPVGLATLSNGKKRLVFPRPGDEERFIKRL